ncbi:hypothetical protein SAMN02746041_00957 [Desulfacinum hydrothermale DSM 13146]|uniref:Uncharacterized protein n=1 Tax=Desulfacinum hydrothermale DSM 13146 TaxID=1121390 RepID=A0A1W1X9J0_9BACT|nr:hypothetical protein [Desulfacinum hydrothermale]SMC20586.1 hypothetical protein SAMN02746041_00957 [Desulfacinum hydrothermale DSM 13146]
MAQTGTKDPMDKSAGTGSLTGSALEAEDVLAGAEEWAPIETKLVLWSFAIAAVALIIGLLIVPTSIFH